MLKMPFMIANVWHRHGVQILTKPFHVYGFISTPTEFLYPYPREASKELCWKWQCEAKRIIKSNLLSARKSSDFSDSWLPLQTADIVRFWKRDNAIPHCDINHLRLRLSCHVRAATVFVSAGTLAISLWRCQNSSVIEIAHSWCTKFWTHDIHGSTVSKLGALQKARLRKVHLSGDFLGVFDFLRIACYLGIPQENLSFNKKSPIFTNTPCKSTCLYNARSMHTVEWTLTKKLLLRYWLWL